MSVTLQIRYKPHPKQLEFHQSKARFRILASGRRWGKTKAGANEFIKMLTEAPPRSVGYCVAPTYSHTEKQWKEILYYCPRELIIEVNVSKHRIKLIGEREIQFKSADNPDTMRGESVSVVWVDEHNQIKEDRWTMELRPSLMDTHGKGIFTGTPKGKNWGFQLFTRGQDPSQTDYKSFAFSSYTNPYLDPKEIDEFKRDMPELAYRQEILAEFLDDVGSVFRRVKDCINGSLEPSQPGKKYVAGCDLAKHEDFTVIYVLDYKGHLCHSDRFSQLDWVFQSKRIAEICKQYGNARLIIDSTGVGDPIFDYLKRLNVKVEGYKYTTASKADLIENLSQMIETKQLTYPNIPELINELGMFGYHRRASGTYEYSAPDGYHDDCVNALALAAWQLKNSHNPSPGVFL